jgi:hypothetical protein
MRVLPLVLALLLAGLPAVARSATGGTIVELPPDQTLEAQGPQGTPFTFEAWLVNPAGKQIALACEPPSGTVFPLGATTVVCHDDERVLRGSFQVTVGDTTPPVLSPVSSLVREADGSSGARVEYPPPTAIDLVDGPVQVTCAPVSGSTFPLGTTPVACSAADTRGNAATVGFDVTVRDTTPPILIPPAAITVTATTQTGIGATAPPVAAFLAGARTSDLVTLTPAIVHDAPPFFPVGTTVVTFTASDEAGNSSSASSTVTVRAAQPGAPAPPPAPSPPSPPIVPPPVPPPPPGRPDVTPPGDVRSLAAKTDNRTVTLTWRRPADADFEQVVIFRHRADEEAARAAIVYRGAAERFVDRGLVNGTAYRYVVVSFDRARTPSRGGAITVTPRPSALLAPADGARLARPPALSWRPVRGATYYNVQLFSGNRKILTLWPVRSRVQLPARWRAGGRQQQLSPGAYRWYVWPGYGPRSQNRYGDLLGQSAFTVVRSGR